MRVLLVSHEVFDAVQIKLDLGRYVGGKNTFPTLDVVDGGVLQGFVSVNRNCKGFSEKDYCNASESIYSYQEKRHRSDLPDNYGVRELNKSIELDGYEITRAEFFTTSEKPILKISNRQIRFNNMCFRKFRDVEYVELLINTVEKCLTRNVSGIWSSHTA